MKSLLKNADDPLLPQVFDYLTRFDFPLAYLIQKKFKIGFTGEEKFCRRSKKEDERGRYYLHLMIY